MRVNIDSEIQGTSVPVRWCLSKDEIVELMETEKKAYLLLLVVSEQGGESGEKRYLVPVEQAMEYIDFYTPGKHKVFATLVVKYENEKGRLKKEFLRKECGFYYLNLYDYDNYHLSEKFNRDAFGVCGFEVDVPQEVFAKEPPEWEKKWVNFFFEGKPIDQCHYRKRKFFAYSVQPFFLLGGFIFLEVIALIITSALLLVGKKGIRFGKILHPFSESFRSIWEETEGSIFGKGLAPLLPSIFLGSSVIYWRACKVFGLSLFGFQVAWVEAVMIGGIVVIPVAVIAVVSKIKNFLMLGRVEEIEKRKYQKLLLEIFTEKEKLNKIREKTKLEYESLVCNGNFSTEIKSLPEKKRTIYLRYKDLKSKVCKSFAR